MERYLNREETFSKTISETDVYLFAGITGDLNPMHIDKTVAENSMFQGRIAHGILLAGFISNVIGMKLPGPGTIYMGQNLQFLKPVRIGDTVTAKVSVQEIVNYEKRILRLHTQIINQDNDIVVDGDALVKAPKDK